MAAQEYLAEVRALFEGVVEGQLEAVEKAGEMVAEAIARGGVVHIFGVGHSHMLAEEAFFRAGGLAPVNAILEPSLMLHAGAMKSTRLEKLRGFAPVLLDYHGVEEKDVLIVISNSGVNAVPVEMAVEARKRNVPTIGITSMRYSRAAKGEHGKLYELVDLAIDNGGPEGDAVLEIPGLAQRAGPSSTVIGAALVNAVIVEAIQVLRAQGQEPPVYLSSHLPGAMAHNQELARRYERRIRAL